MCAYLRTGPAAEAWYEVVAGGGHIAGVGQVALVQVVTPGAVTCQAGWTYATPGVRGRGYRL